MCTFYINCSLLSVSLYNNVQGSIGISLPELVRPVLTCFEDPDARVRYYACEALYNISKVARGAVLVFFNNIFDGLCKVSRQCGCAICADCVCGGGGVLVHACVLAPSSMVLFLD